MKKIRIAIADDHPMIIGGLKNMLADNPNIELTGIYPNGAKLLEGLENEVPDVLLLDIQLPDKTGTELAPIVLKKYPNIRILTLTNLDSALYVNNMLRLGAHGYVLKTIDPEMLINAIEIVYNGGQYIDGSIKEKFQEFAQQAKKQAFLKAQLTPREKEILKLVVNGYTGQEISEHLHVGFKTVEYYRINLLLKLDVKNTAAMVKKALEMGLTD